MIRPIDIRLNAAHPELPLAEAVTFTGSPSTVLIRGVPPNCGRWAITAVFVAASFPDGSTTTRAAVQSANGVWVATLPATATSGRTANGVRVMADGIDENGEAVTGYILGVADFAVASLGVTPAPEPGETSYQMLYFDAVPSVLHKGDVAKIDGTLKFYNGTAWEPFAAPVTFDDAVTRTSANGVKSSGIWSALWGALSALPTGFSSLYDWCVSQLAGKLDKTGDTMTGSLQIGNNAQENIILDHSDATITTEYIKNNYSSNKCFVPNGPGTLALTAGTGHTGNLAALDANGNPTDSTIPAANVATKAQVNAVDSKANQAILSANAANDNASRALQTIPYDLGTPTVIDTASSEVVEGETVYYGAATLSDRTANIVQVTAATALDELRITFPAATSGKVRDFGLRVEIGTGSSALAAPALVPIGSPGEIVKIENNAAEIPALADGTATAKGVTLLYFSENAPGVFVVKGEQVEEVA